MTTPALGIYKHYKGNIYNVLSIATHSETLEKMVVYQAQYGDFKIWVRPLSVWLSAVDGFDGERFSKLNSND